MKKLLFIAGVAAACAAFADPETVTGTTEVGMLKIESTATNCVVAVPYLELSTGGNICVSNIVKTANLTEGDSLYVYGGSGWTAWVLTKDATTLAKYWQSVGTAKIGANGVPQVGKSPVASSATLVPGSAIWLIRKDPAGSNPFYVYGGYQQALSTTVTKDVNNLVANPTDAAMAIDGAEAGDVVKMIAPSGLSTKTYTRVANGWTTVVLNDKGRPTVVTLTDGTDDAFKLPAGQGVWYTPKSTRSITWRSAAAN